MGEQLVGVGVEGGIWMSPEGCCLQVPLHTLPRLPPCFLPAPPQWRIALSSKLPKPETRGHARDPSLSLTLHIRYNSGNIS